MITEIKSEKLVIISDLHIGNPFSQVRQATLDFIFWAAQQGYDICLNGDGFEVAQASMKKLAQEIPPVLQAIKLATQKGRKVYYVVGNHDIVFEHFLNDWGGFTVSPFLNLRSGQKRIRIEHGHLYDPFFVHYPRLYEYATWLGGFFLQFMPQTYRVWIAFERFRSFVRGPTAKGIIGEPPNFLQAARELQTRGFDAVVFGHTHHAGIVSGELGEYYNPGSFMLDQKYICIESGRVSLLEFKS